MSVPPVFDTALTLHQNGHLAEAEALYKKVLQQAPKHVDAWAMLGALSLQTGNIDHSLSHFETAISLDDTRADIHSNRGLALQRAGRHADAMAAFQQAISLRPDYAEAYNNLGQLLAGTGNDEQARAVYLMGLEIAPDMIDLLTNLANICHGAGENREALLLLERAIEQDPDDLAPWLNRIEILQDMDEARAVDELLAELFIRFPYAAEAENLAGIIQAARGEFDPATRHFRKALVLNPEFAQGYYNLGNALQILHRNGEALEAFSAALKFNPDYDKARFNRALLLLDMEQFEEAWADYEYRFLMPGNRKRQFKSRPWNGKDSLDGKTILLWNEQGFGDSLQFLRFCQVLKQQGATVILQVQPELLSLVTAQNLADRVIADTDIDGANAPDIDVNAALMSLPGLLKSTAESIPASCPYIMAPAAKTQPGKKLKAGLIWAGAPGHANDQNRSLPLGLFAPLFENTAIDWFSFQMGDAATEHTDYPDLRHLGAEIQDFTDTANLMAGMDVLVSVDTAPAHLAGAMNIPLFLLVPAIHDWRWGAGRYDSLWYPSATLFRQRQAGGQWLGPLAELSAKIDEMAKAHQAE